ncbi:MAG: GDSL-type esterase/lipase family protein [Bacteroidota bacterium]
MLKRKNKGIISLLLVMISTLCLKAQSIVPFVKDERNIISSKEYLQPFYTKLALLKDSQFQINILHIGDSHLQADFLTQRMRDLFESKAGRGLIVPCRVAKTNESRMYKTKTYSTWQSRRAVKTDSDLPIGIGGITIQTFDDTASIVLEVKDNIGFNSIKIFHQNDETAFDLVVTDENGNELKQQDFKDNKLPHETVFRANQTIYSVIIQNRKNSYAQWQSIIYGIYVCNNEAGVIYSSLGVNGAEYRHYNDAKFFAEQTQSLAPDLIILSLGTNEAANTKFEEANFYNQIQNLVNDLQNFNPNALILLTTPADSYRRKKQFNPIMKRVSQTIVNYCKDNNIACWDLYNISGGYKSARFWKKYQLFAKDNLHYNVRGYQLQAELLYQAIINSK